MIDKPTESNQLWSKANRLIKDNLVSIIMPAFNLEQTITQNLIRVHSLLDNNIKFEIIVVNDGSSDKTKEKIEETSRYLNTVIPVHLPRNLGKGQAIREGFYKCRGSYIILLDADLDLIPEQIPLFFDIMYDTNSDIVIGSKRHPESQLYFPIRRRIVSACYYFLVRLLFGLPITDTQTGIKLFKRHVLEYVIPRMLVKRFAFDLEILEIAYQKGFKISEAPVKLQFKGKWGSVTLKAIKQTLIDTLAVFYRARILDYYRKQK